MNRRRFLQNAACAPAFALRAQGAQPSFAYVGTPDAIHVFRAERRRWSLLQSVPSLAPSFLAIHPGRNCLYAANEIDAYRGLSRGTVEAYAIDVVTGRLDFLNRRPLSLSATSPRHLAISPDGKMLAVAARAGGIYNLLSIESDGSLGSINALRKDVGCGPHAKYQSAAYPHSVAFHPGGHLVATDLGCDRVSSFAYADCRLIRKSNISAIAGAGPGALALHPSGLALYVNHELRPVISCHRFRPDSGEIEKPFQIVATPHPGRPAESALAIGSRGDFLYSARTTERSVTAWTIDPISGEISQHDVFRDALFSPRVLLLALARLYVLHRDCGAIMQLSIDPASGKFQDVACVAYTSAPRAIALLAH